MDERSPHEKSLHRVMVAGTAIAFGALAAIVASMDDFFAGNATFRFSLRTIIGFIIGAGAGLAVGAIAGWPLVAPALVGAALGAGIGAATADKDKGSSK